MWKCSPATDRARGNEPGTEPEAIDNTLRVADLIRDHDLMETARREAFAALGRERKAAAADPHIVALEEVYRLMGLDEYQGQEKRYAKASR